jgi:hypothetical protein
MAVLIVAFFVGAVVGFVVAGIVLWPGGGVVPIVAFATALALMGRVVHHDHEPLHGEPLGVEADGLFLHASHRVNSHEGGVLLVSAEVVRNMKMPRKLDRLVGE